MKLFTKKWYKKLNEADDAELQGVPNPAMQAPAQPPQGQMPSPTMNPSPNQKPDNQRPEDISRDPQSPDMPEDEEDMDFEQWKDAYYKESVRGDVSKLMDLIQQVRNTDLDAYPHKFVEDNLQILFLRQYSNIDKASKEIRKLIKTELDQNNPSTSLVNHMFNTLKQTPELNNIFIKLKGLLGTKSDLHRKYIASLLGAVQVGSGANNEDIIYNERDYSIRISTRFNDKWGRVDLGKWALKEDDAKRYLTEPEQKRLEQGSPEEKDVLRRRIVIESIAEQFKQRAFIVNVTHKNGTVYTLGWDLAGSLRAAYGQGKLIVRTTQSENSDAMITDDGEIIPFIDLKVKFVKETGELDEEGKPAKEEYDFLEKIDGVLFLTSRLQILKEAASSFTGIVLKETPYVGNPSDIKTIMRCVPSSVEI